MKILLIPIGSSGDVHPFLGLAAALKARGHRVVVITNDHYESLIRRCGLEFIALGTSQDFLGAISDPDIWHPLRGLSRVGELCGQLVRPLYDILAREIAKEPSLVVAHSLAFGARVAQEKLGLPLVTVHLAPAVFRSEYEPPILPSMINPPWMPRWYKRGMNWLADVAVVDRVMGAAVASFRAELGLPPVRRLLFRWWNSPLLVLGLFPQWFAQPQPDWPPQVRLVGFPLFDERGVSPALPGLEEFLRAGDKPIVFTPGSAMRHGESFFQAAIDACRLLQRRGILLTRFADQVPSLPAFVRHFEFVPLGELLPRAAAIVHHGGIGTTAQGLAGGVPQLVMPMAFDQLDNAHRLELLGVGAAIPPRKFKAPLLAAGLRALLEAEPVASRCREVKRRFAADDHLLSACLAIEQAGQHPGNSPVHLSAMNDPSPTTGINGLGVAGADSSTRI